MKIVGGNFGTSGSAHISRDGCLVIRGIKNATYSKDQIAAVSSAINKEKKFSVLSFLVGLVILGIILGLLLNIIGIIIAIALSAAGSNYSTSTTIVEVTLTDHKSISLESTNRDVKKLHNLAPA